ncbi:hypothetical protein GWA97_04975 [Flavobacterium sp. LaA7.5]|nr:hypothetical protein [Flavobacterium salilacus subsp. altitudinum]
MAIENEKNREKSTIESQNASVGKSKPVGTSPSNDPAIINPEELATFPKQKETKKPNLEEERDSHLANKVRSEERRGRNITNTGTMPDDDGFM